MKLISCSHCLLVCEGHLTSVEQLILIGDHKQLQPKPATMEIARRYNLRLSLFERLVHNQIALTPLEIQHRMRPEIADLVRWIYTNSAANSDSKYIHDREAPSENLRDGENVLSYENIRGVSADVFFWNHEFPEHVDTDTLSHYNKGMNGKLAGRSIAT